MKEAVVLGYDRASQSWITGGRGGSAAQVPSLDGLLLRDDPSLSAAAEDFGHMLHQRPSAVLEPGSSEDVVRMVNFAREQGISIGPRGQGHNTFGRSLVGNGIVVRMSALNQGPVFGPDWVEVDSGSTWIEVLSATLERGFRPPVVSSNLELSVGGTLSVGGVDGGSYRHGVQVDNVLELQVVTGEGRLRTCSATELPELFNAVLAGQGQCAIILRARLRLIPAQPHVLFSQLLYTDLKTMLADQRLLIDDGRFDRVSAYVISAGDRWVCYLQGGRNFTPPDLPDQDALFAGLRHLRGFERTSSLPYLEYANRGVRYNEVLRAGSRTDLPHPWFDAFLPDSSLDEFAGEVLAEMDPSSIERDFPVEFYCLRPALCTRPLFRLPEEPLVFLIDVLTTAAGPAAASHLVRRNRRFFERVREMGGKFYPVNAVPMTHEDWREHYGPAWDPFAAAKRRFDPDTILSPGPGIF
jgi:cytokinin dehydrogenase